MPDHPPTGTFLTRDELYELTGWRSQKKQIEWLAARSDWPFEINCLGWPVVLRATMEGKMGVTEPAKRWELDDANVA